MTIIAHNVDDFFVFSNDKVETDHLKAELAAKFKVKDLGQVKQIFGMNIFIDKEKGNNLRSDAIASLLTKFGMSM